ncbi:MAG: response regulator transcription factor [Steroidobacteraceae bacterium]
MQPRVLIVDDDRELAGMLGEFLEHEGFQATLVHDPAGVAALALGANPPDLVVLDVMLPGRSGFELLRELRRERPKLPILMLTARGDAIDRILGLELGADDYLPKPFDPRELAARMRAVLRRSQALAAAGEPGATDAAPALALQAGPLRLDLQRREARFAQQELELTGAEFRVLACLARQPAALVSRAELTETALGRKLTLYDRSIDTHVSNLRRKLERLDAAGEIEIRALRGSGYQLLLREPHAERT